jgi:murein DD-endopeptidase MepM/ murein hydrolase activator NlpD
LIWRVFFLLSFGFWTLFGAEVLEKRWKVGETFSDYLIRNKIPLALIGQIRADDIEYLSEIQGGEKFYELREGSTLLQALIPIGEEMQIEIIQDLKTKKYKFDIKPIIYKKVKDSVVVKIKKSCYQDLLKLTNNSTLNYILQKMYKRFINFRYLRAGDKIAFEYTQKSRLGKPWGTPKIAGAVIQTRGKSNFVFIDKDGKAWSNTYKELNSTKCILSCKKNSSKNFTMPLKKVLVSSKFTYKRWHPILHKYRPHLGVDLKASKGTPIYAIGNGKVIYSGWMRGYGKVIKIDHKNGYISLYAHQSRLKAKLGEWVKRGEVIGFVGSTGRSTGPHLHLGVYKKGKAINPFDVLKKSQKVKVIKVATIKKVPIKGAKALKKRLIKLLKRSESSKFRWDNIRENFTRVKSKERYVKQ